MIYLHKYHRGQWRGCVQFRRFADAERREIVLARTYGRLGWRYEISTAAADPMGKDGK